MVDLQDKSHCPGLVEIAEFVQNPVFLPFCGEVREAFGCSEKIEYSGCSMAPGWNVKFKKAGKALCTVYPKEGFFTVMVAVGRKEKEAVEAILPDCCPAIQDIYEQTREGNGQRWLMIGLEDRDELYRDVFRLMQIRRGGRGGA